jgi:secreted trypsin-like serine protease
MKFSSTTSMLLLTSLIGCNAEVSQEAIQTDQSAIQNGQGTYARSWMVSLQVLSPTTNKWVHFCGGSLIDDGAVVTAAHCMGNLERLTGRVCVGVGKISECNDTNTSSIRLRIPHNAYDASTIANDIAVLKLDKSFPGKSISIADSIADSPFTSDQVELLGWGFTSGASEESLDLNARPDQLQSGTTNPVSTAECRGVYYQSPSPIGR